MQTICANIVRRERAWNALKRKKEYTRKTEKLDIKETTKGTKGGQQGDKVKCNGHFDVIHFNE